ncbi:dephospho-CoA kinase [Piscinibacter terrae]|uniref:Dephospho-CoA kinase n=1 Tax=Piscinibacter terrae TaxID=2496871 RepID=A0A3N7HI70_9BURK|nr:dephospho-CoA kinase [Albitalea terrae]RQP21738.1 dephospho-CoA kinase [Albitalea terrae]
MPGLASPTLKLCLVAPSGSGKSTTAGLMRETFEARGLSVGIVKLAAPLYRLQSMFYAEAGMAIDPDAQDQRLLESVATHLRRIHPESLARRFLLGLADTQADVVINDDLRDDIVDWPALQRAGFIVVKLVARPALRRQRLASRMDPSIVEDSPLDAQMARIRPSYVLTNNGSLDELRSQVEGLCARLLAQPAEAVAA